MSQDATTRDLAEQLLSGRLNEEDFLKAIGQRTFAALQDANVDLDRRRRVGFAEVIFGEGKTDDMLIAIINRLRSANQPILATRITPQQAAIVQDAVSGLSYHPVARTLRDTSDCQGAIGEVAVVTAGTGDLDVAEEASETLRSRLDAPGREVCPRESSVPGRVQELSNRNRGSSPAVTRRGPKAADA